MRPGPGRPHTCTGQCGAAGEGVRGGDMRELHVAEMVDINLTDVSE